MLQSSTSPIESPNPYSVLQDESTTVSASLIQNQNQKNSKGKSKKRERDKQLSQEIQSKEDGIKAVSKTDNTAESTSENPNTSKLAAIWNSLVDTWENNKSLGVQVILNFFRDFVWTYWSYEFLNWLLQKSDDENYDADGQWFGQQFWATLVPALAGLGIVGWYKWKKQPEMIKDAIIYTVALAAAVYTWDRGQQVGIELGQDKLEMSAQDAAYFASVFTGLFEGVTQYSIITLGNLLSKPEEREKFKENPLSYLGGLGLSGTIGAVPGGVWQIVFVACVAANLGPVATGALVAAAVAACNIGSTKVIDAINAGVKKWFYGHRTPEIDLEKGKGSRSDSETESSNNEEEQQQKKNLDKWEQVALLSEQSGNGFNYGTGNIGIHSSTKPMDIQGVQKVSQTSSSFDGEKPRIASSLTKFSANFAATPEDDIKERSEKLSHSYPYAEKQDIQQSSVFNGVYSASK